MDPIDKHFEFDFHNHDPYYDCITEDDGDIPDEIVALLEIEADFSQGR
jgi:hypothetical protein